MGHVKLEKNDPEAKHDRIKNSTEGGRCLDGSCKGEYDKHSCSYRYQGMEAALGHKEFYNFDDDKLCGLHHLGGTNPKSVVYKTLYKTGKTIARAVCGELILPIKEFKKKVTGTTNSGKPKAADVNFFRKYNFVNFTIGSVPWANQVHHVLPKEVFREVMRSFSNIQDLVEKGLYKEGYNINHKKNMVILPEQAKYARLTGLPIHNGGHGGYNDRLMEKVEAAFSEYIDINKEAKNGNCKEPKAKPVKDQLEKISATYYAKILAIGNKGKKGSALKKINSVK